MTGCIRQDLNDIGATPLTLTYVEGLSAGVTSAGPGSTEPAESYPWPARGSPPGSTGGHSIVVKPHHGPSMSAPPNASPTAAGDQAQPGS